MPCCTDILCALSFTIRLLCSGYIEGRLIDPEKKGETNFERLKKLNFNEMLAFLSKGLGMDEEKLADWLDDEVK